ncbi:MAG: hypothetical protein ACM3PY_06965 [Omnitrophica WOR_2 bacterium]
MNPNPLVIERLNDGKPVITPTELSWENGGTVNPAAVYLERSPVNDVILKGLLARENLDDLRDGAVAVFYRAISAKDTHHAIPFSSTGLAIFTPGFELIKRYPEPVLSPGKERSSFDAYGTEDPRITRIGNTFYMLYCGPRQILKKYIQTRLCLATSNDLLHWIKHGPLPGDPDRWNNKDGVLFPGPINGKYYLLHRPWGSEFKVSDYSIYLSESDSPEGAWNDIGMVLHSKPNPAFVHAWVGAGTVPIPAGNERYIVIYHTGQYLNEHDRQYDMAAALFDFNRLSRRDPQAIVTRRIEPLMTPRTPYERSLLPDGSRLDVLFPCGSYEKDGFIYILYGAADLYTAAARVNKQDLLNALEESDQ